MKKKYMTPEALISLFDTKDVITASITGSGSDSSSASMTNGGELSDGYSDNSYKSIFGE
ncbi:MAG: hypothetical protein NC084_13420 [Bacteroides sp.]|nr:hypothetical protein [Eubacterium sp.]MCM1419711.1 hypothetical protein [Roseburia sp.]MCM1463695.1 hypothetical protein [Bacteroides sp.]